MFSHPAGKGTHVLTDTAEWHDFVPRVRSLLERNRLDLHIDGRIIRGYRAPDSRALWIRDYSDMLRTVRYFEKDVCGAVQHFAETQAANGRIFDFVTTCPDRDSDGGENWTRYVRVPVESDVEFRFVKAAWLAWSACGDSRWIRDLLPALEKALAYATSHPWRWEPSLGLVKRPYTLDTWDFAYTAGGREGLQFQIDDATFWGIMHGDNSGYYEAFRIMERLHRLFGAEETASRWGERAERLRAALERTCWNGRFFTHFVKLVPVEIPGVDEKAQLSLSNAMAVNRGVVNHAQALSILDEYRARGRASRAFAEWFSIDPPFPDGIFGDRKLVAGAYVNGGIMPLVGGELARAAFEHGRESYGVDILRRYRKMISASGESYLWYFPDGTPSRIETSTSPEASASDGWGSGAMLWAFIEGLAGIVDEGGLFRRVRLSPRWPAADVKRARVRVEYPASGASLEYEIEYGKDNVRLDLQGADAWVDLNLMLPEGRRAAAVREGKRPLDFHHRIIEESRYLRARFEVEDRVSLRIGLV